MLTNLDLIFWWWQDTEEITFTFKMITPYAENGLGKEQKWRQYDQFEGLKNDNSSLSRDTGVTDDRLM